MRTGAARSINTDVETVAHTKIGSRLHVSPGARIVITVDEHVEAEQRHRQADEGEERDVRVHPHVRLLVQRRVTRPARREATERDGRHEDHTSCHQQPEREGFDTRERHPARADQNRHEVVGERAEDPARHHPHHHRAVDSDEGQIVVAVPGEMLRPQQLEPDQHRVQAADEDEDADPDQVLHPDDLVVGAEAEVPPGPLRLLLAQRCRPAEHPLHRIVRKAEADQEPDHAGEVRDEERDVVLPGVVEVVDAGRLDEMPEPPADVEADDAEDHRRKQVEAEEALDLIRRGTVGSGA